MGADAASLSGSADSRIQTVLERLLMVKKVGSAPGIPALL